MRRLGRVGPLEGGMKLQNAPVERPDVVRMALRPSSPRGEQKAGQQETGSIRLEILCFHFLDQIAFSSNRKNAIFINNNKL